MTNHFTANPNHLYPGQDRFHRFEATDNPVESTGQSNKMTLKIPVSLHQLVRLQTPVASFPRQKLNKITASRLCRQLDRNTLKTVMLGDPSYFVAEIDGDLIPAINFHFQGHECDVYFGDPLLFKWVNQDRFFYSLSVLQDNIKGAI